MSIFLSLYSRYQKRAFADSLSFLQSKYPFKDTTNKGNKANNKENRYGELIPSQDLERILGRCNV